MHTACTYAYMQASSVQSTCTYAQMHIYSLYSHISSMYNVQRLEPILCCKKKVRALPLLLGPWPKQSAVGPPKHSPVGVSIVMADPQNGWFKLENPMKMDDLGMPPISANLHVGICLKIAMVWMECFPLH